MALSKSKTIFIQFACFFIFIIFSNLIFANHTSAPLSLNSNANHSQSKINHFFIIEIEGGAGAAFSANRTSQFALHPNVINRYVPSDSIAAIGLAQLFLGYSWLFPNFTQLDWGLGSYFLSYETQLGTLHPAVNMMPDFDTLTYSYHVRTYMLLSEWHYSWQCSPHVWPFAMAGVGLAINRMYRYNERPTDPNGSASSMTAFFGNHTNVKFAAAMGFGFIFPISLHAAFNMSYRLLYAGQARLAASPIQTTRNFLHTGNLLSQVFLLGFSFKIT